VPVEGWEAWLADYRSWLVRLGQGMAAGRAAAEGIFTLYGLAARFGLMLDKASAAEGARRKKAMPEDLGDEELDAIEAEVAVGLRHRMFSGIEVATRAHANELAGAGDVGAGRLLTAAVDSLERSAGLLRVNLNDSVSMAAPKTPALSPSVGLRNSVRSWVLNRCLRTALRVSSS
jgi:hypothetical protein